jgi:hypothetical protein
MNLSANSLLMFEICSIESWCSSNKNNIVSLRPDLSLNQSGRSTFPSPIPIGWLFGHNDVVLAVRSLNSSEGLKSLHAVKYMVYLSSGSCRQFVLNRDGTAIKGILSLLLLEE